MNNKWAGKAQIYKTARWQALRKTILLRDRYQCQLCGCFLKGGRSDKRNTLMRPAVVDHLIPHHGDEQLFHDPDNLWAVCDMDLSDVSAFGTDLRI